MNSVWAKTSIAIAVLALTAFVGVNFVLDGEQERLTSLAQQEPLTSFLYGG